MHTIAPSRVFASHIALYVVLSILALVLGVFVYIFDRPQEDLFFLPKVLPWFIETRHAFLPSLCGVLPSFVHTYAFILLSVAVFPYRQAPVRQLCLAWLFLESIFEIGQHPYISHHFVDFLSRQFIAIPVFRNYVRYGFIATFDWSDIVSIVLGTIAAYLSILLVERYLARPLGQE